MQYSLYGHPDSGTNWEEYADSHIQSVGFKPISQEKSVWPSCYYHEKLRLMLVVYVDDFKLAGPKENMAQGWALLRGETAQAVGAKARSKDGPKGLGIEPEATISETGTTFLGCIQKK